LRKLPFCLSLLLFFPVFLWAADGTAVLPSVSVLRAELVRLLREEGFDVEELPPPEYGGNGESLLAAIPARKTGTQAAWTEASPSPDIFILGVPLRGMADGGERIEQAAGKFPFGIAAALSFLKIMKEHQADKRVAAVFLDDTRGLEDLASSLDYPENAALVYLDFASPPGEIVIHHGVRGGIAPLAMVRPLHGILEKQGIPHTFGVRSHELYNLGLAEGPAVLERARSLEIPAILLTGVESVPEAGDGDALAEALAEYARAVRWDSGGMDTHYSLFSYGKRIFFLSERLTLILILFLAGIGIALRIRRFMPRRLKRRLPLTNTALLHQSGPEEPPVPAGRCAHIAVFLAILGIMGGTFLDLSCAPAFIWALAFTILGSVPRFVPAVFICAFLSPFKGAETIFQTLREGAFAGKIGSVTPLIYLLPIFLVLPFLLLVLRGIILIVEQKNSRVSPEELEKSGL
jgi:hypothetical protein